MSYYKDQDLRPEVRERNVRDAYKRLHKLEAENSTLQDKIKGHELERDQLLKEIKSNSSYRNVELEAENKKLREALEFYADEGNSGRFDPLQAYQSNLDIDSGSIARKVLNETK